MTIMIIHGQPAIIYCNYINITISSGKKNVMPGLNQLQLTSIKPSYVSTLAIFFALKIPMISQFPVAKTVKTHMLMVEIPVFQLIISQPLGQWGVACIPRNCFWRLSIARCNSRRSCNVLAMTVTSCRGNIRTRYMD